MERRTDGQSLVGALAKYTLYLASRSATFIALTVVPWPGSSKEELLDSIVPVATGFAMVAEAMPADARAFHVGGPLSAGGYAGLACVELLVHAHDAASGLGATFRPPTELASAALVSAYPDVVAGLSPWRSLLKVTGRPTLGVE